MRGIFIAVVVVTAVIWWDNNYNNGTYTRQLGMMVRDIRHGLGH